MVISIRKTTAASVIPAAVLKFFNGGSPHLGKVDDDQVF